jgi:hypothetical protein
MDRYATDICKHPKNLRPEALLELFQSRLDACRNLSQAGFSLGERSFLEASESCIAALKAFHSDRLKDINTMV